MVDGLYRLGHDAVVGGDDEDDDVRHLGAARTHGREGLVAGGVDKGYILAVNRNGICADMLGYAARFACGDVLAADIVEKGRLAVVDVSHDGDDGRAGNKAFDLFNRIGLLFGENFLGRLFRLVFELDAHTGR